MKKEVIARFIVVSLILVAVAIPLAGSWVTSRTRPGVIELHARMPENGGWSLENIQAQVGQTLHLRITSEDVVHGFAIGHSDQEPLPIQPGEFVETTLTFEQPGRYTFYCTRWCGPNHWRMRGTIDVTGPGQPVGSDSQPLFLKLGIDIDAPHDAQVTPQGVPVAERGAHFANLLPPYATDRDTYLTNSPAQFWQRLRSEPSLAPLLDSDIWDVVAWIWQSQSTPQKLADGQKLYSTNCAACHAETGKGDGVMVRNLPQMDYQNHQNMERGLARPPDFTEPRRLLGASPALLEGKMIRGGMGTGMPYWGPIFTTQQMDAVISYLYTFAFPSRNQKPLP